ncbi:GNAT family N-acetyltransferase [Virgibacillus oceani]
MKIGTAVAVEAIRLKFYCAAYLPQLKDYRLSISHREFTGVPLESIEICSKDKNRHSIIIDYHGSAIGYFVLHKGSKVENYFTNDFALLLRTYSVDSRYQGMGIAKQSMKLLPAFVKQHFPEINEIVLAVNQRNAAAQHVYMESGFLDTGRRLMGRKGEQLIFQMKLGARGNLI